jgi:hypothetical protein
MTGRCRQDKGEGAGSCPLQTQPKDSFSTRTATILFIVLIQEISHIQINQPVFPGTLHADISYIPARYFYGVVRITIARRGASPLVDQSEIVPFNVHGVLEGMLRFFNQIKNNLTV